MDEFILDFTERDYGNDPIESRLFDLFQSTVPIEIRNLQYAYRDFLQELSPSITQVNMTSEQGDSRICMSIAFSNEKSKAEFLLRYT